VPVGSSYGGLRILMLAPQPFVRARGTPLSVLHRIRALLSLGHRVDLVTYPFGDRVKLPGLSVHRASRPPGIRDVEVGPSVAKVLLDLTLVAQTLTLLRQRRFDLVHTHEEAGALGAWISRRYGIPHIYDMHSSLPQQFANFGRFNWRPVVSLFHRVEGYTLSEAAGVIAICPALCDHLSDRGYDGPVALIENSLDFEAPAIPERSVDALRISLGVEGAPVVLYTGTLELYQGLELLIRAARAVQRAVPEARFVVVGGTSEQARPLQQLAADEGVETSFVFVPAVPPEEVFRYHRLADVLVTCRTRGTNTPLKIYQYLRAGRPIVATSIHSHTQVLDEATAELVEPTAAAVARGLTRMLLDQARAARLAEAASVLAETRYSDDVYLQRMEDLLDQVVGPRQPSQS
jgi:glycosyltransferase involved in cell wall biosynthesis